MRRASRTVVVALAACGLLGGASLSFAGQASAAEHWGALGVFGAEGSGAGQFREPSGIAVDDATGDVYVVDKGNRRVEEFNSTGAKLEAEFSPPGGFSNPDAVAVDNSGKSVAEDPSAGDVYVTDLGHDVIDKFTAGGAYLGRIAGTCPPVGVCSTSDLVPFAGLAGVAVDSKGIVWVENGAEHTSNPEIDSFSDAQPNAFVARRTAVTGGAVKPGLAIDSEDNLYVVAHEERIVMKFNSAGDRLGEGLGGVKGVSGVVVDSASNDVYIDSGASVTVVSPAETFVESFGGGLLNDAGYLAINPAVGPSGYTYVSQPAYNDVLLLEHSEASQPPPSLVPVTEEVKQPTVTSEEFTGKLNPAGAAGGVGYFFSYHIGAGSNCTEPGSEHTTLDNGGSNLTGNTPISVSATVSLQPGAEYVVCLVGYRFGATVGSTQLFLTSSAAPDVISESLSSLSAQEGSVSAAPAEEGKFTSVINPENEETTYQFEYSTAGSVANNELDGAVETASGEPLSAAFVLGGETVTVSNVRLHPRYYTFYYRVVAKNKNGGTTVGKVQEYTKAPLIEGESVSGVTTTSTVLEANINPDFMPETTYYFEYATEEAQLGTSEATVLGNGSLSEAVNEQLPVRVNIAHLRPGATYYYRVVAQNEVAVNGNEKGIADGTIQHFTMFTAPTATTGEAQNITGSSATLSGTVDPESAETTCSFQYISEVAYQAAKAKGVDPYTEGETTVPVGVLANNEVQAVGPTQATGLRPGETYHYRLVATNRYGAQGIGEEKTFTTTPATPPSVSTGTASGISQNGATLSGMVTTNGLETSYGFEIGTEPGDYGPATGLGAVGGSLTEEVSVALGELQPGTTYYYRVTATNADGTVQGLPESFATPGFPTLLVAPQSLPVIATPNVVFPAEESASGGVSSTKGLTSRQKLARALRACHAKKGKRRASCEAAAYRKYGAVKRKRKR